MLRSREINLKVNKHFNTSFGFTNSKFKVLIPSYIMRAKRFIILAWKYGIILESGFSEM